MGQGWNAGEHTLGKPEQYFLAISALISQNERKKGVEGDARFFGKGE
jgi:hypothetical protein